MKKEWKNRDIALLRQCYLEQKSLKVMARLLGRSPTAVNKCLTRFNIRPMKKKVFFKLAQKALVESHPIAPPCVDEVREQVLQYARGVLGLKIDAPICHPRESEDTENQEAAPWIPASAGMTKQHYYRLNNDPITFRQILLRVNMHRVQHNLPPFVVA